MITANTAERLKTDADFMALQKHINEHINSLNKLDDILFTDGVGLVEGRARQLAVEKLKDILEPFIFSQQTNDVKINETKKKVGLY